MRGPQRIGEIADGVLAESGPERVALARLVRVWPSAVGPVMAREAWPSRIDADGVLLVACSSSTWASELTHLGGRIREQLAEAGLDPAPELRFRVGQVPRRPADEPAPRRPPSPAAQAAAKCLSEGVRDPALRAALERAAAASIDARDAPAGGGV